jgi:hypothetical protein
MVAVREALERGRALGAREADVGALDAAIDWSKYPKLRAIFEHRPRINVYWLELVKLAADIAGRSGGQGK